MAVYSLADLPSDILRHILHGSRYSFLTLVLWKTGDRHLQAKMVNGVDYLDLKDRRLASTSRYPKMISRLANLRYLSINRGNTNLMPTPKDLSEELQKLNGRKLETLKIKCLQSDQSFCNYVSCVDGVAPTKPVFSEYRRGYSYAFDMEKAFPSLQMLKIGYCDECLLAALPDSLTILKASSMAFQATSDGTMSKLPRSLLVLDLGLVMRPVKRDTSVYEEAFRIIWAHPPPHLHTIKKMWFQPFLHQMGFSFLPRTLVHCLLMSTHNAFRDLSIASLPPLFDTMIIGSRRFDIPTPLDSQCLSQWPQSLKHLEIGFAHSHYLSLDFLSSLPRTLESIVVYKLVQDWEALEECILRAGSSFWPPRLQSLSIKGEAIPQFMVKHLPASLTSFDARYDPATMETSLDASLLDASLLDTTSSSTLNISSTADIATDGIVAAAKIVSSSVTCWPPLLTKLDLFLKQTMNHMCHQWPSHLKDLSLHGTELGTSFSWTQLPSSIHSLTLWISLSPSSLYNNPSFSTHLTSLMMFEWPFSLLSSLPRTLTELSMGKLFNLDDSDYNEANYTTVGQTLLERENACLLDLPPLLRYLQIDSISTSDLGALSGRFLSQLGHLEILNCQHLVLDGNAIQFMPPSLEQLFITLTHLTPELAGFINPLWQKGLITFAPHLAFFVGDVVSEEQSLLLLTQHWPPSWNYSNFTEGLNHRCHQVYSEAKARAALYPDPRIL